PELNIGGLSVVEARELLDSVLLDASTLGCAIGSCKRRVAFRLRCSRCLETSPRPSLQADSGLPVRAHRRERSRTASCAGFRHSRLTRNGCCSSLRPSPLAMPRCSCAPQRNWAYRLTHWHQRKPLA